jgi:flagellin-like hook-associated protein FlgL
MMSSRISFGQISNHILDRLFMNYNKLEGIQSQLASGSRLEKPSDDPVATSQSLGLRSDLDQYSSGYHPGLFQHRVPEHARTRHPGVE